MNGNIPGIYQINNREAGDRREFERGLGNAFFLVGTAKVAIFCLLHELLPCPTGMWIGIGHITVIKSLCKIALMAEDGRTDKCKQRKTVFHKKERTRCHR
jgi:hypothetical protein